MDRIPKKLAKLDWWFSPFGRRGYQAPAKDLQIFDQDYIRVFKDSNCEIFLTSLQSDYRNGECVDFNGEERLIWYFAEPFKVSDWQQALRFFWGNSVLVDRFVGVFKYLLGKSIQFWVSNIYPLGIVLEIPEYLQSYSVRLEVARIIFDGDETKDLKEFIKIFMTGSETWDFSCCFL